MELFRFLHLLLFFLLAAFASSSPISDDIFESYGSTGRTLLQAKAACAVDFENQNYTIITSQCKGPNYQAKPCCNAFKQLACPFAEKLNDQKSDCATTLFSYINLYGKYPPGLFSSLCREGKEGLDCKEVMKTLAQNSTSQSGGLTQCTRSPVLMLAAGLGVLVFNLY